MIKALLHRKIRWIVAAENGDDREHVDGQSPSAAITALEDPLTSGVFERIAYLTPAMAWALLRAACVDRARMCLAEEAMPTGEPKWSFWPSLNAAEAGANKLRVEPDVLVEWGNLVLVIEAKHAARQVGAQWIEQVGAIRTTDRFRDKDIVLMAAGGADFETFSACANEMDGAFANTVPELWWMRWEALRAEVDRLQQLENVSDPGTRAILHDIAAVLDAWGYRPRLWFDTLPAAASWWRITTAQKVLAQWIVG